MSEGCVQGATNAERIKGLEKRAKVVEDAIAEIRDGLLRRPSWAVTIIITILSSLTFASLTFAFAVVRYIYLGK